MANRSLGTLSIDLVAKIGGFTQGLDKAEREATKRAKAIETALSGAVGVLAGAASISTFTAYIKNATDSLDQLNDVADATGSTVESISALEDVARRTGATIDTVESSLVKFNSQLTAADGKNEVSRALKQIGVDAEDLKRLDPAEALRQTAVALSKFASDGDKARAVQILFGKSVKEVAPFLKDLAEAGELNATVTTDQAQAAEKFNKQIFALQKELSDIARITSLPVIEQLNNFFDSITRKRQAYGSLFAGLMDNFRFDQADDVGGNLTKTFNEIEAAQKRIARINQISARDGISDVLIKRYAAERKELEDQLTLLNQRQKYLLLNAADPGSNDPAELARRGRAPKGIGVIKDTPKIGKSPVPGIEGIPLDRTEAFRQFELAAQAATDQALATAQLTDAEKLRIAGLDEMLKAQSDLNALLDATPSAQLAKAREQLDLLADALAKAADPEQAQRIKEAMDAVAKNAGLLPIIEEAEKVNEIGKELGLTFSSAFEDAIVGGEGLSDIFKGLEKDIARIIVRKSITEPLGEAIGGLFNKSGGGGNIFESAFSAIADSFAGGFAKGGTIPPGQFGIVGENGPEFAFGGTSGLNITPNGGGRPLIVHVQAAPNMSRDSAQQQGTQIGIGIQRAMSRNS